jgi:hypothetical protein
MLERTDRSDVWTAGDLGSMKWDAGKPLIGPPPWESPLLRGEGDAEPMSRYAFDATWREFSRRAAGQVRAERDDPAAEVRYYAEKHQDTWLVDLGAMPPVRLLVLLRDPRDTFVSFHAFDAKRRREGTGTFVGAEPAPGETEAQRVDRFIGHERERMRWIAGFGEDDGFPVFRYEELVTDLAGQAHRLEDLLSVDLDLEAVVGDDALRDRHVSADSPAASIGRWRRELEPGLAERFNDELAAELEALGYQPSA